MRGKWSYLPKNDGNLLRIYSIFHVSTWRQENLEVLTQLKQFFSQVQRRRKFWTFKVLQGDWTIWLNILSMNPIRYEKEETGKKSSTFYRLTTQIRFLWPIFQVSFSVAIHSISYNNSFDIYLSFDLHLMLKQARFCHPRRPLICFLSAFFSRFSAFVQARKSR